jgi:hypothetical protein
MPSQEDPPSPGVETSLDGCSIARVKRFIPGDGNRGAGTGLLRLRMRNHEETPLRRIVLMAGLLTTLAGGAAALAAPGDPAAPDAAPADPYLGSWSLNIDGKSVGPVTQVDGCSLKARVVITGSAVHVADVAPEPCTFDAGAGMSSAFYALINDAIARRGVPHDIQLVRTDARSGYGLELDHATVAAVTLPKVDRASTEPVFLKVSLGAEVVRRVAVTKPAMPQPVRGFDPAGLDVRVAGVSLGARSAGPWTATMRPADAVGQARDYTGAPPEVKLGALAVRVPEPAKPTAVLPMDAWVQSALIQGADDQRPVTVALPGLQLSIEGAGLARADLAPRADGNRSYELFAGRASITAAGK